MNSHPTGQYCFCKTGPDRVERALLRDEILEADLAEARTALDPTAEFSRRKEIGSRRSGMEYYISESDHVSLGVFNVWREGRACVYTSHRLYGKDSIRKRSGLLNGSFSYVVRDVNELDEAEVDVGG